MHLTRFTDYALRVLIYTALRAPERVSIERVADVYGISRNHVVKVVHRLARLGYLETTRGRGGGLRLARDPAQVQVGAVVRALERATLVECFDAAADRCPITPACRLKGALADAFEAFLAVLDQTTLADLVARPRPLAKLLHA